MEGLDLLTISLVAFGVILAILLVIVLYRVFLYLQLQLKRASYDKAVQAFVTDYDRIEAALTACDTKVGPLLLALPAGSLLPQQNLLESARTYSKSVVYLRDQSAALIPSGEQDVDYDADKVQFEATRQNRMATITKLLLLDTEFTVIAQGIAQAKVAVSQATTLAQNSYVQVNQLAGDGYRVDAQLNAVNEAQAYVMQAKALLGQKQYQQAQNAVVPVNALCTSAVKAASALPVLRAEAGKKVRAVSTRLKKAEATVLAASQVSARLKTLYICSDLETADGVLARSSQQLVRIRGQASAASKQVGMDRQGWAEATEALGKLEKSVKSVLANLDKLAPLEDSILATNNRIIEGVGACALSAYTSWDQFLTRAEAFPEEDFETLSVVIEDIERLRRAVVARPRKLDAESHLLASVIARFNKLSSTAKDRIAFVDKPVVVKRKRKIAG